jgi:hypothetical protein
MITLYITLVFSILVQLITGIIEIALLFLKVPTPFLLIKQLLILDVVVQFIEASFYTYWLLHFRKIQDITPKRYVDWMITTPTMLFTLIFYLLFLKYPDVSLGQLLGQEASTLLVVLGLNWLMLLFGYLGEIKVLPLTVSVSAGFVPFFIYFYIIHEKYGGSPLFYYFFFVWFLYGVAAMLPYTIKNMSYNVLDLFSKNFFGIFLGYVLWNAKL